jgi:hypothetical protein
MIGPTTALPEAKRVPLQLVRAVHEVALVELHDRMARVPYVIGLVLTVRVAVGITLMVTLAGALVPVAPLQVSE